MFPGHSDVVFLVEILDWRSIFVAWPQARDLEAISSLLGIAQALVAILSASRA